MKNKFKTTYFIRRKNHRFTNIFKLIKKFMSHIVMNRLVFAIVSGLIVGSIFGFIILHLLQDDRASNSVREEDVIQSNDSSVSKDELIDKEQVNLPSVYVVQVGLYNDYDNASKSKKQFANNDIPTFIWERDGQYYLFSHIASSEEIAKIMNEKLNNQEIESFVKQWELKVNDMYIKENELQWYEDVLSLWNDTLKQVENEKSITVEKWETLLSEHNINSQDLLSLSESMQEVINGLRENGNEYIVLLHILFLFEKQFTE